MLYKIVMERSASSKSEPSYEHSLLEVAQKCAGEIEVSNLAITISDALFSMADLSQVGVSVLDEERQSVQRFILRCVPKANEVTNGVQSLLCEDELPITASEIPLFQDGSNSRLTVEVLKQASIPFYNKLYEEGIQHFTSVPLRLGKQLLGTLYVASSQPEALPESFLNIVEQLGRIITPALYNCLTHARFARGDRRRDTLIELSKVLNSSLEVETVIKQARQIISGLEGHCKSAIFLLDKGNRTYRCYPSVESTRSDGAVLHDPTTHQINDSVLSYLLDQRITYESSDLDKVRKFSEERDLYNCGVRRYLAIPLSARGRMLGAFIFGTQDSRPRRKVEYWLYENIALQMALAIDNAIKHEQLHKITQQLARQNTYLREEIRNEQGFGVMIGQSDTMDTLRSDFQQVAQTDAIVLITGETGVGKELVAREIHKLSSRAQKPLIKVNCPSIPEGMFESELFGHERGAFTSAVERRIGRFELAHDGTLFLDEIGELSLAVQAKLLRVLQDGEFERIGGSKTITTNARIIAATNRNLEQAVKNGLFRADLYYRLNVFPLSVPPLRDRREDIPSLAEVFLAEFSQRFGKRLEPLDEESLNDLTSRDWPGNVRELRHFIERAVILSTAPALKLESLVPTLPVVITDSNEHSRSSLVSLDTVQADHIRRALKACRGVIEGSKGAAGLLGIKPSTLRFRIKRLGVDTKNIRP